MTSNPLPAILLYSFYAFVLCPLFALFVTAAVGQYLGGQWRASPEQWLPTFLAVWALLLPAPYLYATARP